MDIKVSIADKVARMSLGGRFDFSAHKEFRDTTEQLLSRDEVSELDVDLAAVNYVDSSALGMLLMLRDKARNAQRAARNQTVALQPAGSPGARHRELRQVVPHRLTIVFDLRDACHAKDASV